MTAPAPTQLLPVLAETEPVPTLASFGPPRLLAGLDEIPRMDRVAHLSRHGSLPQLTPQELVALAEDIDLRGRGGADSPSPAS